jgi:predicted XRE-type DNA-binding protein
MKSKQKAIEIKKSSGNIFADLRLPNPQEALAKAKLTMRICDEIRARGLTQAKAAELLGLDQPKVSALMRGNLNGFSTERLFRLLNELGQEVEITIRPVRQLGRRGKVQVVAAGA